MLLATSFIAANVCGQSLTTITEYYDYFRTRVITKNTEQKKDIFNRESTFAPIHITMARELRLRYFLPMAQ